ncbi:CRISPR-associated endonuclease Cas2 [Candidatus Bathyarchaeota archaeon]|nr:MAG: CRISPR-associated endonuclease Cas2 [Candidatus Bathyarchaeota archaeon]
MVEVMRYLIIYDITDDNLRNHVSELLKDYGLQRIQYSAFIGNLRRDKLNSLTVDLRRLIGEAVENVQIYPLCDLCFKGRKEIGKPKRYELVEEKRKIVYF